VNKVADDSKPWNHVEIGPDVERDMDGPSCALKRNQGLKFEVLNLLLGISGSSAVIACTGAVHREPGYLQSVCEQGD
jgi:hypothetical protein